MVQNRGRPAVESCATNDGCKSRCLKHLMDCIALRAHTQLPSGGTLVAGVLNHAVSRRGCWLRETAPTLSRAVRMPSDSGHLFKHRPSPNLHHSFTVLPSSPRYLDLGRRANRTKQPREAPREGGDMVRRLLVGLAFAALATVPVGCGGCNKKPRLFGGGSSFVDRMMQKWASAYADKGVQVDYTSSGSGDGVSKMIAKQNDYGCTDAPMNEEQLAKAGGADAVIHVPLVMGAVVPIYNLPGIDKPVRFT